MTRKLMAVSLVMMMGAACGEGMEQPSSPVSDEAPEFARQDLNTLPVVKELRTLRQGCDYVLRVLQENSPYPYPNPYIYRVTVRSEVVTPSTCTLVPGTVELGTSKLVPDIALVSNTEGIVAAYSSGEYVRSMGNVVRVSIHSLDPNTLGSLRVTGLASSLVPSNGGAGAGRAAYLGAITLQPGYIEVSGTFTGNSLYEYPATIPYPYPIVTGTNYVATYPNFHSTTMSPYIRTF